MTPSVGPQTVEINCGCRSVGVTDVDSHGKGPFSDDTNWSQAVVQACVDQMTANTTGIHHCMRHGSTSTTMDRVQSQGASDTEATTSYQTVTPAKSRPICLAVKEVLFAMSTPSKLTTSNR